MNKPAASNTPPTLVQALDGNAIAHRMLNSMTTTTLALLFHQIGAELATVTVHKVASTKKGNQVMPGRPLSPEDEQGIIDLLMKPEASAGLRQIIPETILATDRFSTLWWSPGKVRPMHIVDANGARKVISVAWPSLVMFVQNRTLYLCAVPDGERPTRATKVFHAPLGNVYSSTEVCVGNATLPIGNSLDEIAGWEYVVYGTAYSHKNHDQAMRNGNKFVDPMEHWSKSRKKPLAATQLSPLKKNLGQWWDEIASGKGLSR